MNNAELDRLFQQAVTEIVSVEITDGPGPLPRGVFEQAPRVIATLNDYPAGRHAIVRCLPAAIELLGRLLAGCFVRCSNVADTVAWSVE